MSELLNNTQKNAKQDPFNWEGNHGIEFLSQVLWELGHPEEPKETLLDVLKSVHEKTAAHIISLEHAAYIHSIIELGEFEEYKMKLHDVNSRIYARRNREKEQIPKEEVAQF
jgi:hypothetical protein